MTNLKNLKKFHNFAVVITTTMLIAAIISSTISYAYALPPSTGYGSSNDCTTKFVNKVAKQTCCYRKSTGVSLGDTYCQTCTLGADGVSSNCSQEELQFRSNQQGGLGTIFPDDGGVLAESEKSNQGTEAQVPLEGGVFSKQP
jgi:hypothetical protein